MAKTTYLANRYVRHIFLNEAIPNLGDVAGLPASAAAGSVFAGFFTADPTPAELAVEATYTGYARTAVARSSAQFTATGAQVANDNDITGPAQTSGGATAALTHFGWFDSLTGGNLLKYGALSSSIAMNDLVAPEIPAGSMTVTES
jgi:hypothetical protein